MGRKKKKVEKPWCWYCNREFEDEKILIQHQKAKHFKCHICHKKLFSGPGLAIHCMQVHKETVTKVPSAIPGRDSTDYEIYGMSGLPEGAARGQAIDDRDEPAAKQARMDNMPPMPPGMPPGMPPHGMPPFPPPFPMGMPPYGMPPYPPHGGPMPPFPHGMPPMPPYGGPPGPYQQRGGPPNRYGPPMGGPPQRGGYGNDYDGGYDRERENRWGNNDRGGDQRSGDRDSSRTRDQEDAPPSDYRDSPRERGDSVTASVTASNKLGAKTRIMHPDDHTLSLEERRAMLTVNVPSSYQ